MARLRKECDLRQHRTAAAESSVTVLHEEPDVVSARHSDLELESETLQNKLEALSRTHAECKAGLAEDLGKTRDNLRKETREFGALKANVAERKKVIRFMRDAPKISEEKI